MSDEINVKYGWQICEEVENSVPNAYYKAFVPQSLYLNEKARTNTLIKQLSDICLETTDLIVENAALKSEVANIKEQERLRWDGLTTAQRTINERLQVKLEKCVQYISERCCIDDCGFDVYIESRPVLEQCMIAIDKEGRELLKAIGEL